MRVVTAYIMPIPDMDSVLAAPPLRANAASSPWRHFRQDTSFCHGLEVGPAIHRLPRFKPTVF